MSLTDLLLTEFDEEAKKTRTMLERVPAGKGAFAPHPKSTPIGKLAPHIAQLGGFGLTILTTPNYDFSLGTYRPLPFESAEQLVRVFDEGSAKVREALQKMHDAAWSEPWHLSLQGRILFKGSRFLGYRQMYLNHLVHHRAQLGVYLRLNDVPLPSTYGPSADEPV